MKHLTLMLCLICGPFACAAHAVTIDMVPVGNPGNAPDTRYPSYPGHPIAIGSVGYVYQMGKYEVTAAQYTEFLNAVAKADPNGLYNTKLGVPGAGSLGANIQRSGTSPNYSYTVASDWANRPVNYVSFWDAARFANWLHNGQPTGAQGPGTTEDGSYHDIGNATLFGRSVGATFVIPNKDEWYKAAYHEKSAGLAAKYFDFPTGTAPGNDTSEISRPGNNANYTILGYYFAIGAPYYRTEVGEFELSHSPYGTFDQGGNVDEWNETIFRSAQDIAYVALRGGSFLGYTYPFDSLDYLRANSPSEVGVPSSVSQLTGFRVANILVPEPSTATLFLTGATGFGLFAARRRRASKLCQIICHRRAHFCRWLFANFQKIVATIK